MYVFSNFILGIFFREIFNYVKKKMWLRMVIVITFIIEDILDVRYMFISRMCIYVVFSYDVVLGISGVNGLERYSLEDDFFK